MAKYSKGLADEIAEWIKENGLISYGGAKLKDFCARFRLDNKSYYNWYKNKEDFREAVDEAKEIYKQNLSHDIVKSLAMAAKGYEREETETEYVPSKKDGKPIIKRQKNTTKHIPPNVAAGIFLITNIDPEHFQNKQRMDVGGKLDTRIEIGFVEAGVEPASSEDEVDV